MSRRVEITLALPPVLPVVGRLRALAASPWKQEPTQACAHEIESLLELFHPDFSNTGIIVVTSGECRAVLRACSFLRIQLRHTALAVISDTALETGLDLNLYTGDEHSGISCYVFLGFLQETLLKHIGIPQPPLHTFTQTLGRFSARFFKLFRPKGQSIETARDPAASHSLSSSNSWRVVVLNDPVNLMAYVAAVLQAEIGLAEVVAQQRMKEVHEQKSSTVWEGPRDEAEACARALRTWHLNTVLREPST